MAIDPRFCPAQCCETLTRLGTMKPTCFGLLDFTAGYHQTPLDPASRVLTAFRAAGGLYQWTRVAMGRKGYGPYFQRSMQNKVFAHFHNPRKDYGSNRLFQNDLKEALEKDAAYTAKPSLQGLLTAAQLVMNS